MSNRLRAIQAKKLLSFDSVESVEAAELLGYYYIHLAPGWFFNMGDDADSTGFIARYSHALALLGDETRVFEVR